METWASIGVLIARIEERDRRPELPSRARELGTKVSVLMCGPRVPAKGEREGLRAAGGLRTRGRCRAFAGLARAELVRPAWLFFFCSFLLFYFLISEIQITFEIQVQIGSNQFE